MQAILFSDGGSRGNPGPAGIGFSLQTQEKTPIFEQGKPIGKATNNVAEYKALIQGINKAVELGYDDLKVFIDSQLIEKQIKGEYKVKSLDLLPYYSELSLIIKNLKSFEISHIRREFNKRADELVNEALDLNKEVVYTGLKESIEPTNSKIENNKATELIKTYLELGGIKAIEIYEINNNMVVKINKDSAQVVIEKLPLIRDMIKDTCVNVFLDVR